MSHPLLEAPLSELEDSDFEAAPIAFGDVVGRGNTAETSMKLENSSEDGKQRHGGGEIVAKDTWALSDSGISETDSEYSSDSSDAESEASDVLRGIKREEIDGDVDGPLENESESEIPDRARDFPVRRLDNDRGKRDEVAKAKIKHVTDHGTFNEVQWSKPWEVIAEEHGVTGSVEAISQALEQAGIPYGDRRDAKPRATPKRDQGAPLAPRKPSSPVSKSSTQNSSFSTVKLSPRDLELMTVAFRCWKNERGFQVDYQKLANLAGFNNPGTASAVWSGVRKKLLLNASFPRLSAREAELVGLAFQSLKDDCVIQIDYERFAELAGYSSASSGNASWLVLKKKLVALASLVAHASPAPASRKRRCSATTMNSNDSESQHMVQVPKKRRGNAEVPAEVSLRARSGHSSRSQMGSGSTGGERRWTVPHPHKSPDSNQRSPRHSTFTTIDHTADQSRQLSDTHASAANLVESPNLHTSREPPDSGTSTNNTNDDSIPNTWDLEFDSLRAVDNQSTRVKAATTTNIIEAGTDAPKAPIDANGFGTFVGWKDSRPSDVPKKQKKWNAETEHSLLLAIIEFQSSKMDYEAVGRRVGCSGNAIQKHCAKLRKEIQDRADLITLLRPQDATETPLCYTEAAAKSDNSTARHGFPNATKLKDTLFVKSEIAKLESSLGAHNEHPPWSNEEGSALERGMRRFSGPYWSDILALFGPNGSVNDVLKHRDEAQLEDKACRDKISCLKSGVKCPLYLRLITGGHAARDDGKGAKGGNGEDQGQVKGGVAVTSDEGPTTLGGGTVA